jgi:hypothetical protein
MNLALVYVPLQFNRKISGGKGNDLKKFWVAREMTHATRETIVRLEICSRIWGTATNPKAFPKPRINTSIKMSKIPVPAKSLICCWR